MMWGEIEPCPASSPVCGLLLSSCETVLHSPGLVPEDKKYDYSTDAKEQQGDNESVCPSELSSMIEAVAASKSPVKSQQLGDPDLTLEERRQVLLEQYRAKPLVFLERYAAHLRPEHLAAFAHLGDDCRAQHYCREVQRRATSRAAHTRVRNKRYAALRALQQEGQYFSEEQMRVREPLLYEQYIGQYLSEEELCQRAAQSMSAGCTGLADLLMNSYQERLLQNTLQQQQDREEEAQEETEEEAEECCEEGGGEHWEPSEEEKGLLKEEFLTQMHQRFLDGKDKGFNYSEVDENPDYDNLDIVSRDAEERYFDDDDDDEEEEGEVEEEEEEDDEEMQ